MRARVHRRPDSLVSLSHHGCPNKFVRAATRDGVLPDPASYPPGSSDSLPRASPTIADNSEVVAPFPTPSRSRRTAPHHHTFVRLSESLVRTPIVHGGQGASKDESQRRADFTQRHPESPRLNRHFAAVNPHRHSPSSPIVCTE